MVKKTFFVFRLRQRLNNEAGSFVLFVTNSKDINEWVGIKRVGEVDNGTQRILKETRVKAIKRFFTSSPVNIIPVSVIIAFNPGATNFISKNDSLSECMDNIDISNNVGDRGEWGILSFEYDQNGNETDRPAIVVDGQHRIRGMASVEDEEIPIVIAAFLEADHQEQAFQFVVINNKAQKVPTDNVKAIISDIDEEALQQRLLKAGVNYGKYPATLGDIDGMEESPFYHLLNWPLNPTENRKVELTTIESCLRYIKSSLPILAEDDDSLKQIFINIWTAVSNFYPRLWNSNAKFMTKVNLLALNEFILDRIENSFSDGNLDIYISEKVINYTKSVLESISVEFWETDWLIPIQDNTGTRNKIKDDLRKISQNVRASRDWKENLQLIPE